MVELLESASDAESPTTQPDLADIARRMIVSRRARIGVVGMGYVGLPLGVAFADAGFDVLGFDVNSDRVATINAGRSHIPDVPERSVAGLVRDRFLGATADLGRLGEVDVVCICVPTPLNKTRDPDISYVVQVAEQLASHLRQGQLVVLESTTYPGTTRDVVQPLLEASGLSADRDFFLAFSPERVDPGNIRYGIKNTPKVVGGLGEAATELAALLYRQIADNVVPVSSPDAAEMVKLLENTFRSVNIALANEIALMCGRLGLDVWEVVDAAATKPFGFMPFYPGPGIGGHCIPLDPLYLAWKMRTLDYRARFIELAAEINGSMPHHVVDKVVEGLNEFERSVKGSQVLVLGAAYKPDIDDARESPALDVIELLRKRGAIVSYSDPFIPELTIGDLRLESVALTPEQLAAVDCVVIVTNHRRFDYASIVRHARLIVDTRNALAATEAQTCRVIRL